jgi:deoxyribonuclease V
VQQAIYHRWDLSAREAKELQARLANKVIGHTTFEPGSVHTIAGVDASFGEGWATAAVAVLSFPELTLLEVAIARVPAPFPYVPGLLAFREGPGALAALERLDRLPDLLTFDAHGVSHPRRFGLASHIGVLLDRPSIGCAKSRLVGSASEPGAGRGDWTELLDEGQVIGAVVRTRTGVKPLYVSVGHRVDLDTAVEFVLQCGRGRRLPETIRLAHQQAGRAGRPPVSGEGRRA